MGDDMDAPWSSRSQEAVDVTAERNDEMMPPPLLEAPLGAGWGSLTEDGVWC